MERFKVLDLFAGAGGLGFAFHRSSDFEVVAANELLRAPARTYEINHPGTKVFQQDVRSFSRDLLADKLGSEAAKVDVILGGPPCQSYSTAGKRSLDDPRAMLFNEYYRLLKEFGPKIFVFENVKGLLSMQGGKLFDDVVKLFESAGYKVEAELLNAADYGVPQLRERIVIVGKLPGVSFDYPNQTHSAGQKPGLLKYVTLKEALSDLPRVLPGEIVTKYGSKPKTPYQTWLRSKNKANLMDHNAPVHGEFLRKIMEVLPEGGSAYDLPEDIRPKSGFGNSYGRLWWDKPAPTITRNLGTPSSARCIHPSQSRALTTREGARLQSFPDDFTFYGSRSQKNLQIGEAVPPLLSFALIGSIRKSLDSNKNKKLSNEPSALIRNKTRGKLQARVKASN